MIEEPVTVEERAKWEKTQNLSTFVKTRNSAADTFTPYQIKFLTKSGRKNMGIYGMIALTILFVLTAMNAWALKNESVIVIANSLLAFVVSLLTLEKMISGFLNSFIKQFQ